MRYFIFIFTVFTSTLVAVPIRNEFSIDGAPGVFYLECPKETTYPLMIVIEGSFVEKSGPQSVLRLHNKLAQHFLNHGIAIITMERRGVEQQAINEKIFHQFNTPTQRLRDHLALVHYLRAHPPKNWNGQLFIMGGSEGGPIAIKLAYAIHPEACIPVVGCGDQSFKEYIWSVIQAMQSAPNIKSIDDLPLNRQDYETQTMMMKANPDPTQFWFGQTFCYWEDALDQTEYQEFLGLKCPVLVVAGSKDIECASTDRIVEQAQNNNQDITYLRIDGMAHDALDPQWNVVNQIVKYLKRQGKNP